MLQVKLDEYFTLSNSPRSSMSSRTSSSSGSPYRSYDSVKKQQMYSRMGLNEYTNGINVNDDTAVYDVMEVSWTEYIYLSKKSTKSKHHF